MPAWRRAAAGAVALAMALAGAPVATGLRTACAVCAPTCPMHQKASDRLPCHEAPRPGRTTDCGATVTRPGCGETHEMARAGLPPAVLPSPIVVRRLAPRSWLVPQAETAGTPGSQRPETPPPITAC
jgi:hypothetical protein